MEGRVELGEVFSVGRRSVSMMGGILGVRRME